MEQRVQIPPAASLEDFCRKYIDFFEHYNEEEPRNDFQIFDDMTFPKECETLGFNMDCGYSFIKAFGEQVWLYPDGLEDIVKHSDNKKLIGSAIFSKWRFFNHWANSGPTEKDIEWFLIMLRRLQELVTTQRWLSEE